MARRARALAWLLLPLLAACAANGNGGPQAPATTATDAPAPGGAAAGVDPAGTAAAPTPATAAPAPPAAVQATAGKRTARDPGSNEGAAATARTAGCAGDRCAASAAGPAATASAAEAGSAALAPLHDGAAVFAALRERLQEPGCSDDDVARRWMRFYARSPRRFSANLERVLPALAHVTAQVRAAGLPGEYALLPIVESWYRADARNGDAAGPWQFSAATARAYGLRVDGQVDQRLALGPATEAALAHLSELQQRFGDWRLAVMAFNAGAYRLAGALQAGSPPASPEQHAPPGLAMTTYEHLGKLLALACLVREPGRIGLELPDVAFEPLGAQQLHALASTAPHATERGAAASTKHTVRSGDSLWAIARRYGVHVRDLLRWNLLEPGAVIQPGQLLRVQP